MKTMDRARAAIGALAMIGAGRHQRRAGSRLKWQLASRRVQARPWT